MAWSCNQPESRSACNLLQGLVSTNGVFLFHSAAAPFLAPSAVQHLRTICRKYFLTNHKVFQSFLGKRAVERFILSARAWQQAEG